MTPRALTESGRPGIGREVFPETAKETGRRIGLEDALVQILKYERVSDGAGDVTKKWVPQGDPVRGRLKSIRHLPHQQPIGGRVSESSTHLVELDPGTEITTDDRLEIWDTQFIIISKEPGTETPFLQVEVKEL